MSFCWIWPKFNLCICRSRQTLEAPLKCHKVTDAIQLYSCVLIIIPLAQNWIFQPIHDCITDSNSLENHIQKTRLRFEVLKFDGINSIYLVSQIWTSTIYFKSFRVNHQKWSTFSQIKITQTEHKEQITSKSNYPTSTYNLLNTPETLKFLTKIMKTKSLDLESNHQKPCRS